MRSQLLEALQSGPEWLGGSRCISLEPQGHSSTWRAALSDGRSLFVKLASPARIQVEAQALDALKRWADPELLLIPDALAVVPVGEFAALIIPWLDLRTADQYVLGQGLAALHQNSAHHGICSGRFGWDQEGFIGLGPQAAGWSTSWGDAFVRLRLRPQLQLASRWGLDVNQYSELLVWLESWLGQHDPCPCLVHGDLWSGNAAVTADGRGVLIDPASWWADREVDLAMSRLFGGFSQRFYEGYQDIWPLPADFESRTDAYNLYHLLNHANLFGGGYQKQSLMALSAMRSMLMG